MITYEVNITVHNEIVQEYYSWLLQHVEEMLQYQGFQKAIISKEIPDVHTQSSQLIVHYFIDHEENLTHYLQHQAPTMREKALKKFGNQFSATRRIFSPLKELINQTTHHSCATTT